VKFEVYMPQNKANALAFYLLDKNTSFFFKENTDLSKVSHAKNSFYLNKKK